MYIRAEAVNVLNIVIVLHESPGVVITSLTENKQRLKRGTYTYTTRARAAAHLCMYNII